MKRSARLADSSGFARPNFLVKDAISGVSILILSVAMAAAQAQTNIVDPPLQHGSGKPVLGQNENKFDRSATAALQGWSHLMKLIKTRLIASDDGYIRKEDVEKEFRVHLNREYKRTIPGHGDVGSGRRMIAQEMYKSNAADDLHFGLSISVDGYDMNSPGDSSGGLPRRFESSNLTMSFSPPNFSHPEAVKPCVPYDIVTSDLWRDGWKDARDLTHNIYEMTKRGAHGIYVTTVFHQLNCVNSITVHGALEN